MEEHLFSKIKKEVPVMASFIYHVLDNLVADNKTIKPSNHPGRARLLTLCWDLRVKGQSQIDSFYGVEASQKVTEACKGFLGPVGNLGACKC